MDESQFQSGEAPTRQGMDNLQQVVEANDKQSQREGAWAEEIVSEDEERAMRRELSPTIMALERRLEQIRSAELERYRRKLGELEPVQRRAVETVTRGILNKILHGTACELKAHTGAPEQHALAQLVGRIFGLDSSAAS